MLFEVMHEAATQLCDKAEAAVAAVSSPRDRLRALIRVQLDCLTGEGTRDYYAVMIAEWRELDAAAKPVLTVQRTQYSAIWHTVARAVRPRRTHLRSEPHLVAIRAAWRDQLGEHMVQAGREAVDP